MSTKYPTYHPFAEEFTSTFPHQFSRREAERFTSTFPHQFTNNLEVATFSLEFTQDFAWIDDVTEEEVQALLQSATADTIAVVETESGGVLVVQEASATTLEAGVLIPAEGIADITPATVDTLATGTSQTEVDAITEAFAQVFTSSETSSDGSGLLTFTSTETTTPTPQTIAESLSEQTGAFAETLDVEGGLAALAEAIASTATSDVLAAEVDTEAQSLVVVTEASAESLEGSVADFILAEAEITKADVTTLQLIRYNPRTSTLDKKNISLIGESKNKSDLGQSKNVLIVRDE